MIAACLAVAALTALLAFVLHDRKAERQEWTEERAQLLDRIEAPGTVVVQRQQDKAKPLAAVDTPYENPWSSPPIED